MYRFGKRLFFQPTGIVAATICRRDLRPTFAFFIVETGSTLLKRIFSRWGETAKISLDITSGRRLVFLKLK